MGLFSFFYLVPKVFFDSLSESLIWSFWCYVLFFLSKLIKFGIFNLLGGKRKRGIFWLKSLMLILILILSCCITVCYDSMEVPWFLQLRFYGDIAILGVRTLGLWSFMFLDWCNNFQKDYCCLTYNWLTDEDGFGFCNL
jgi:hypothetical protein